MQCVSSRRRAVRAVSAACCAVRHVRRSRGEGLGPVSGEGSRLAHLAALLSERQIHLRPDGRPPDFAALLESSRNEMMELLVFRSFPDVLLPIPRRAKKVSCVPSHHLRSSLVVASSSSLGEGAFWAMAVLWCVT